MIELRNVTRAFGRTIALDDACLGIAEGSFTTLLGPSGCGKSTTLRIIAGLDHPTDGQVLMGGRDVAELSAAERNIAMVFQSYALYPHLSVAENIALPLAMRGMSRLERAPLVGRALPSARRKRSDNARKVRDMAAMLGIETLLARRPSELSGGQKQRVAVARALVREPSAFLLDEPLSNLDAKLRVQMRAELTALHRRTGRSFVYVTHDQAEAMSMSDQIAVFMEGRIVQIGAPRELYETPATRGVAAFVGAHPINFLELRLDGDRLPAPFDDFAFKGARPDGELLLGLRPEDLTAAGPGGGTIPTRLLRTEYLGAGALLDLETTDGQVLRAQAPGDFAVRNLHGHEGETVGLAFDPVRAHLFDASSGRRLDARLSRRDGVPSQAELSRCPA